MSNSHHLFRAKGEAAKMMQSWRPIVKKSGLLHHPVAVHERRRGSQPNRVKKT
jgi:hypothetical protein